MSVNNTLCSLPKHNLAGFWNLRKDVKFQIVRYCLSIFTIITQTKTMYNNWMFQAHFISVVSRLSHSVKWSHVALRHTAGVSSSTKPEKNRVNGKKRKEKKKKHIYIDLHEFSPAVQSHKDTRLKNNPHFKQKKRKKRRYLSLNTTTKFWIDIILQFLSGAKLSVMVVDNDISFIVPGILLTHTFFLHHSKFS